MRDDFVRLAILLILGSAVSSCGHENKQAPEFAVSTEGTAPSGFPLPMYQGAKITISSSNTASGAQNKMVNFTCTDSAENVSRYYRKQLLSGNWKIDRDINANGTMMVTGKKGNQRATVNVSVLAGKTACTIVINQEGP